MMPIIERATEDDLAGVLAVEGASAPHMGTARYAELEQAVRERHCYLARDGWEVVGFALVDQSFFGQYFIDLLIVHPDQRRKGVASALIGYIEQIVPADKLFTSTNQSNTPMQALSEQLGFVQSGWIDNLDEGDPEIIYFKRLSKRL